MITSRSSRIRWSLAVIVILGTIISVTAGWPSYGQDHPRTAVKAVAKTLRKLPPPSFENQVSTVGSTRYPTAFAGEEVARPGHIVVYIVRSKARMFLRFLHRASSAARNGSAKYTLISVRHNWAQLNSLTSRISAQFKQLKALGITLAQWGPDPASNKVKITLESYSARAARELARRFGPGWVSVNKTPESWAFTVGPRTGVTSTRHTDTPPFFGGDAIWFSGQSSPSCESGLSLILKTTGATFTFVADHCVLDAGGSDGTEVITNQSDNMKLGSVSTQYLSRHRDVASVVGHFAGRVWGNNTTNYEVIGAELAPVNAGVTFSGRIYGEVSDVRVESINQDININNMGTIIDDATVATRPNSNVCNLGDSGGPWFQHNNTSDQVIGVGIQSAVRIDPEGNVDPSVCVYEQITNMLSLVNGKIQP